MVKFNEFLLFFIKLVYYVKETLCTTGSARNEHCSVKLVPLYTTGAEMKHLSLVDITEFLGPLDFLVHTGIKTFSKN